MKKVKITKKNEVSMKKSLIEFGFPKEIVENLEHGYYVCDNINIYKISEEEYSKSSATELLLSTMGVLAGGTKSILSNAELNTKQYNGVNKAGKPCGHGYAFEDINNRKIRKTGCKVDASIGKTCKKGGADAVVTDKDGNSFEIQYKCTSSAELAANKIMKEDGYPGQMLYVNTEIAEELPKILKKLERDGKVPLGTANRVVDSGVTIEKARRVARTGTKESLTFDAETALKPAIYALVFAGVVVFLYNIKKEGIINKKVVKKTLKTGLIVGGTLFLSHLAVNQSMRLK